MRRHKLIPIADIFESFEGEGLDIGVPKWFIRFATCPLKCKTCDTKYSFKPSAYFTKEEILAKITNKHNVITLTGGEPLAVEPKKEVYALVDELYNRGFALVLETSGQFYDDFFFQRSYLISADAKSPSTGIVCNFDVHRKLLLNYWEKTQIKIIVKDEEDLNFAIKYREQMQPRVCIITPSWEVNESLEDYRRRVQSWYQKALDYNFIVITQQHKVFFDPGTRAV